MNHTFELLYIVSHIEVAEAIGRDGVVFQAILAAVVGYRISLDTCITTLSSDVSYRTAIYRGRGGYRR